MVVYTDEGVVLRTQKLGETDRIITLLLKNKGLTRAVARGARKTSSKFGARLEPFSVVQAQLYEGKSLDNITQVESIAIYGAKICADIDKYYAANIIVEVAEKLALEAESAQQYALLSGALRTLANNLAPIELTRDAYQLRALAQAGWAPELGACVVCDADGAHRYIAISHGGSVCQACKEPGAIIVNPDTITLISALLAGDWEIANKSDFRARQETAGFTASYVTWHLERGLKSAQVRR